jgi:Cu(I)/Ag(I) efflux system membrane fusion protein
MDLVETPAGVALAVPKGAILDTGRRTVVYVEKEPGRYEARDVVVGPEATAEIGGRLNAFYPVRKGLMEGERVVTRGNFLIDSQRQLAGPAASMYDAALGTEEAAPPVHRH